ncbi:membrane protein [Enterococcus florum]|uniref:Membrane protein n=1 Tax=Enterococcus florum TaxID=2480627 RepID=A0A4P5PC12_9ENTE|nr:TMEM175 family protein [Enterococcus florum]GCF95306.1 membrane protein [Enterococcus florum]
MKERVLVFSDAIIAIILTIMVLELPIRYATNGALDFGSLLNAVGIYFISFCFVANLWFQTAYAFNRLEQVKNKNLVAYMLLLFSLSLVPSATRLLIEDTTQQTILLYGVLTLLVTLVMRRMIVSLTKQEITDEQLQKRRVDELNRQDMVSIFFRLLLLVFGYFFVKPALVIYLILPILAFLQNMIDREEDRFVDSLDHMQQADYFQDRDRLWGNTMRRYSSLLRDSLHDKNDVDSERWKKIMDEWQARVDQEITERQQLLASNQSINKEKVSFELQQLEQQKKRLAQQNARMQSKVKRQMDRKVNNR